MTGWQMAMELYHAMPTPLAQRVPLGDNAGRKVVEDDYPVEDFTRPPGIVMGTVDGVPMAFKEGTERGSMAVMDQEQDQSRALFTDPNAPLGKSEDLLKQMF